MIHSNECARALSCAHKALLLRQDREEKTDVEFAPPERSEYRRRYDDLLAPLNLPEGHTGDEVLQSFEILREHRGGRNLRFESRGIRTTIPLLLFDENTSKKEDRPLFRAIYPIYSTAAKDSLLTRFYADAAVLAGCGIELSSIDLITLPKNQLSDPNRPASEVFTIQNRLKKSKGGFRRDSVIESVNALNRKMPFKSYLDLCAQFFERTDTVSRRVKACTAPARCPFYEECWKETQQPDNSATLLFSAKNKDDFASMGIERLDQIDAHHMEGLPMQYAKVQAARSLQEEETATAAEAGSGIYVDQAALSYWMDSLKWPLSYLDFEWDTFVLSPYEGMKPFGVLCFQYSLHVEQKDGKLDHFAFFESGDCRKDFIEALLDDLPEEGSIVVFNMEGAERLRLLQLAEQFPQYRKQLEAVCDRMVDLATPFESGVYYDLRQRSHSSLKTLLPLFTSSVSYSDLEVHNGVQAVLAYRVLQQERGRKQRAAARAISMYCSLDTLAEKELYDGLNACRAEKAD